MICQIQNGFNSDEIYTILRMGSFEGDKDKYRSNSINVILYWTSKLPSNTTNYCKVLVCFL